VVQKFVGSITTEARLAELRSAIEAGLQSMGCLRRIRVRRPAGERAFLARSLPFPALPPLANPQPRGGNDDASAEEHREQGQSPRLAEVGPQLRETLEESVHHHRA
jgi:hypothetical protein